MSIDHGWEKKCWGQTRCIFANDQHSLHELVTVSGFCCSIHRHAERANSFYVDSGHLRVVVWNEHNVPIGYDVKAGESFEVPSGVLHRFAVMEGGRVFETYWPDRGGKVRLDDIERIEEGGPIT